MREMRALVALALVGYGLTILLGLVAHEAAWVGWASLAAGLLLMASAARSAPAPGSAVSPGDEARLPSRNVRWALLALALVASLGTLAYNVARGSSLTVAEAALVAYGVALLAALPWLGRRLGRRGRPTVMTVVAWSLPVLLAPLVVYALNGVLTSQAGTPGAAASPLVRWALVLPTAWLLELLGHGVDLHGPSLVLATPRGTLTLSVGLVCAGIYPAVLFSALFALYAWDRRPPARQAWWHFLVGLAALWLLNLLRMVVLAKVGVAYGTEALQQVHDQIGWLLFAAFSAAYWWAVLRRPAPAAEPPASSAPKGKPGANHGVGPGGPLR